METIGTICIEIHRGIISPWNIVTKFDQNKDKYMYML